MVSRVLWFKPKSQLAHNIIINEMVSRWRSGRFLTVACTVGWFCCFLSESPRLKSLSSSSTDNSGKRRQTEIHGKQKQNTSQKPDFCPINLFTMNYINQTPLFSRDVALKVNNFCSRHWSTFLFSIKTQSSDSMPMASSCKLKMILPSFSVVVCNQSTIIKYTRFGGSRL